MTYVVPLASEFDFESIRVGDQYRIEVGPHEGHVAHVTSVTNTPTSTLGGQPIAWVTARCECAEVFSFEQRMKG